MSRIVQPSVRETAFNCPHCSAYTTQHWYKVFCKEISGDTRLPMVVRDEHKKNLIKKEDLPHEEKKALLNLFEKLNTGLISTDEKEGGYGQTVHNLHVSKCYNCNKFAAWVHNRLLFPIIKAGVQPNQDMPEEIAHDFEEAREIVNASPRGAAALLRLCIQKLCKHLGEKGKNIDDDIASLVTKGLNPLVQQSLDIVRVIGNEAVHPGVMDLKDDQDTALHLFELVNAITNQMITHPKAVNGMYAKLPEAKRKAIEQRDKK